MLSIYIDGDKKLENFKGITITNVHKKIYFIDLLVKVCSRKVIKEPLMLKWKVEIIENILEAMW